MGLERTQPQARSLGALRVLAGCSRHLEDLGPDVTLSPGLSMRLLESRKNLSCFAFEHSEEYQQTQLRFLSAVESMEPNNIVVRAPPEAGTSRSSAHGFRASARQLLPAGGPGGGPGGWGSVGAETPRRIPTSSQLSDGARRQAKCGLSWDLGISWDPFPKV